MSSKTELYESLYSLDFGVEEALRALARMRDAGFLLPFIDGNMFMMESLRKWVHEGVIVIMTDAERMEWEEYAQARKVSDRALRLFGNDAGTVV
jgi:hypothetical protein